MYTPNPDRYNNKTKYNYCGKSGLMLPRLSLGLWHNFGSFDNFDEAEKMLFLAFDKGITHFDLANNYGHPAGSAESNFGKLFKKHFSSHRDEMTITTKAGFFMWDGPYGDGSSRKYLISSLDQSLKRLGLDYVDIFYSHRYDQNTPIEETVQALTDVVHQGKALYVGISNYPVEAAQKAFWLLNENRTPCIVYQGRYNMLYRDPEISLFDTLRQSKVGFVAYSALAQGILSEKYLNGIPENSRAANKYGYLQKSEITDEIVGKMQKLNAVAQRREQTLAQMSLAWVLRDIHVTSALVGVSTAAQLKSNLDALNNTYFSDEECREIDKIIYG